MAGECVRYIHFVQNNFIFGKAWFLFYTAFQWQNKGEGNNKGEKKSKKSHAYLEITFSKLYS